VQPAQDLSAEEGAGGQDLSETGKGKQPGKGKGSGTGGRAAGDDQGLRDRQGKLSPLNVAPSLKNTDKEGEGGTPLTSTAIPAATPSIEIASNVAGTATGTPVDPVIETPQASGDGPGGRAESKGLTPATEAATGTSGEQESESSGKVAVADSSNVSNPTSVKDETKRTTVRFGSERLSFLKQMTNKLEEAESQGRQLSEKDLDEPLKKLGNQHRELCERFEEIASCNPKESQAENGQLGAASGTPNTSASYTPAVNSLSNEAASGTSERASRNVIQPPVSGNGNFNSSRSRSMKRSDRRY
jgi:hypothetical protein